MRDVWFYGVKGGQGVTVTATAYALVAAKQREQGDPYTVLFDVTGSGDVLRTLAAGEGLDRPDGLSVHETSTSELGEAKLACGTIVVDGGQEPPPSWWTGRRVLVTRACYIALSRYVAQVAENGAPDLVALLAEDERAFDESVVRAVVGVGVPVVFSHLSPNVARAVDAGLLATRLPPNLSRLSQRIDQAEVKG